MQQEQTQYPLARCDTESEMDLAGMEEDMIYDGDIQIEGQKAGIDLSHELRTSLAIITLLSGNLDILYERLQDHERRRMIRDMRKHTQKLNSLIGEVLALCNDRGPLPM
jgi:hypothetical protein